MKTVRLMPIILVIMVATAAFAKSESIGTASVSADKIDHPKQKSDAAAKISYLIGSDAFSFKQASLNCKDILVSTVSRCGTCGGGTTAFGSGGCKLVMNGRGPRSSGAASVLHWLGRI